MVFWQWWVACRWRCRSIYRQVRVKAMDNFGQTHSFNLLYCAMRLIKINVDKGKYAVLIQLYVRRFSNGFDALTITKLLIIIQFKSFVEEFKKTVKQRRPPRRCPHILCKELNLPSMDCYFSGVILKMNSIEECKVRISLSNGRNTELKFNVPTRHSAAR